jgi:hypothetical protein
MKYLVRAKDGRELVIEAQHPADATVIGLRVFCVAREDVETTAIDSSRPATLEVRWARLPGVFTSAMRPEVRELDNGQWGPWQDERDFRFAKSS